MDQYTKADVKSLSFVLILLLLLEGSNGEMHSLGRRSTAGSERTPLCVRMRARFRTTLLITGLAPLDVTALDFAAPPNSPATAFIIFSVTLIPGQKI